MEENLLKTKKKYANNGTSNQRTVHKVKTKLNKSQKSSKKVITAKKQHQQHQQHQQQHTGSKSSKLNTNQKLKSTTNHSNKTSNNNTNSNDNRSKSKPPTNRAFNSNNNHSNHSNHSRHGQQQTKSRKIGCQNTSSLDQLSVSASVSKSTSVESTSSSRSSSHSSSSSSSASSSETLGKTEPTTVDDVRSGKFSAQMEKYQREMSAQYELSEYDSDFSDSDVDDEDTCPKHIPRWAKRDNVSKCIINQKSIDPDTIFGAFPPETCDLEILFKEYQAKPRYRKRSLSGDWSNDLVTSQEEYGYKYRMGWVNNNS